MKLPGRIIRMGVISGHIVLLALFSVRFLAKSKRAGSLWPFGSTKRYLKEAPRRTPSSLHIQYFCGHEAFSISAPCASSELVHFRHRIGKEGMELILKESIRIKLAFYTIASINVRPFSTTGGSRPDFFVLLKQKLRR